MNVYWPLLIHPILGTFVCRSFKEFKPQLKRFLYRDVFLSRGLEPLSRGLFIACLNILSRSCMKPNMILKNLCVMNRDNCCTTVIILLWLLLCAPRTYYNILLFCVPRTYWWCTRLSCLYWFRYVGIVSSSKYRYPSSSWIFHFVATRKRQICIGTQVSTYVGEIWIYVWILFTG